MRDSQTPNNEFDAPWKVAVEIFLEPFLRLCFPAVHALIDWRYPPEFLDTELQQIAPEHAQGERVVDRLIRARLLDGQQARLFIHVEVQAQRQSAFPERMWTYHCRLQDKYGPNVISLAVLADPDPAWRPNVYHTELAGCIRHFEFPVFKVLDCPDPAGLFEQTGNPFALVIAAHQAALATRGNPELRYTERFRLVRHLRRSGMDKRDIWNLTRLLMWLTRLPRQLELRFREEWNRLGTEERVMTIDDLKTPWEQFAMEEGQAKGLLEGQAKGLLEGQAKGLLEGQAKGLLEARRQDVLDALEMRFGEVAESARARVQGITDEARLRQVHRLAIGAPSLKEFLAAL